MQIAIIKKSITFCIKFPYFTVASPIFMLKFEKFIPPIITPIITNIQFKID